MKRKVFTLIKLMIVFLIIMVAAAILSFSGRINNAENMAIKNAYCAVVGPKKDMDFGGFQKPGINYNIYDYPLGNPLEAPHKEGDTWYRKYERGTIVFNTSSGRLDAIKFIEEFPEPVP